MLGVSQTTAGKNMLQLLGLVNKRHLNTSTKATYLLSSHI